MRFARTIAGILLLAIGLPMLFAGGALWYAGQQRDEGGAFSASLERVEISGNAVVVPDLDALLRRDAPLARSTDTSLRITAWDAEQPAFLGLGPAADVSRYLAMTPHARVDRVSITRGPLPVGLVPVDAVVPAGPAGVVGAPRDQLFWVAHGLGVLDLASSDLPGRELSLVVMWPDGRAGIGLDLRAEVRPGWLDPATVVTISVGALLILLGVAALAWQVRPREVVFVVEPSQVPVLAGRLGVPTLDAAGNGRARRDPPAVNGARTGPWAAGHADRRAGGSGQPEPVAGRPAPAANSHHHESTRAAKVLVPGRAGALRRTPMTAAPPGPEPLSSAEPEPVSPAEPEPVSSAEPEPLLPAEPEPVSVASTERASVASAERVSAERASVASAEPVRVSLAEPAGVASAEPVRVPPAGSVRMSRVEPAATSAEVAGRRIASSPGDERTAGRGRTTRPGWPQVSPPAGAATSERIAVVRRIEAGVSPSGDPIRLRPSAPEVRA